MTRLVLTAALALAAATNAWAGLTRKVNFFTAANPEAVQDAPTLTLALDREEYDPLDVTGVAVVSLKPTPKGASRPTAIRLSLLSDGRPVQTDSISPIPADNIDITLDTAAIPNGAYTLSAALIDASGQETAKVERPLRKRVKRKQTTEPGSARVPLTVWSLPKAGGETYPVSTGVPFPQGALASPDRVRLLDDSGRETPCQVSARSLWNREGTVQWLGLDFAAAVADKSSRYFLEYGSAVKRAEPAAPLKVTDSADGVTVDTGRLRFTVKKRGFNLIDEAFLKGQTGAEISAAKQDAGSGLVVVDHEGAVYRASNDPNVDVRVEEQGPFKTVIRAEGWYVKDGSNAGPAKAQLPTDRLCRHVTRLTAWTGKPYVQVEHVWIVTFDSRKVRIRNIGIGVKPAEAEKVSLALDAAPSEYPAAQHPSARLFQRSFDLASLETDSPEKLGLAPKDWKPFGEDATTLSNVCTLRAPGREAGWVTLDGQRAGVTLFIRDLRQLYPKELEFADGRLWAHVWPRHGRPFHNVNATSAEEIYKLWWVHEGRELDFQTPRRVFDALTEYGNNPGYSWAGQFANAMGVGVQTQLLLWFHPAGLKTDEIRRTHDLFRLEPDAQPDPQWSCDSLAYGHIFPRDDKAFPEVERYLEFAFKRNCHLMDRARDYGMFNYRDYHNGGYGLGPDGKWRWGTYRVWESTHYGHNKAILQMYARTADPFYFMEARRNVRHLMNVDVVQYDAPGVELFAGWKLYAPKEYFTHKLGASYHAKGFVHWGGDLSLLNHYSNFDDIYWHYLLRGDLRAREVALRWADEVKKIGRIEDVQTRGGHAPASSLLTLFQNTQDPALLLILDDFQQRFYPNFVQIAKDSNSFNFAPFSVSYLDYAGSETARRALVSAGEGAYFRGGYGKPTILAAAVYNETRKECAYWDRCMESVFWQSAKHDQRGPVFDPRDTGFIGYYAWGYAVRYWLPFLKILRDTGTPITAPARREGQTYPPNALVCFRKQPDQPVRLANILAEVRKGRQDTYDVRLLSGRLADPAIARVVKLSSSAKPGEGETLVPPGEPAGVRYAAAILSSPAVILPLTDAQEMVALPKGGQVRLTEGVWYFRAAPDQKELSLTLRWSRHQDPGNLFFQIRSADQRQFLAGYTDSEDIRLPVQPDAVYCIICSNCGLASPDRDFYLARRAEDIFAVE